MDNTTSAAMTEGQYKAAVIHTLEMIETELGSDVPVSAVLTLLKIPTRGETSMAQLVKTTKITPAGLSRTVATLAGISKANRRSVERPLVTLADDPEDRRYKMVGLTEYGRLFVERLAATVKRYQPS